MRVRRLLEAVKLYFTQTQTIYKDSQSLRLDLLEIQNVNMDNIINVSSKTKELTRAPVIAF